MSYQPDDRHERDTIPPRITGSNVTLDKEKYDKNSIRNPQPPVHTPDGLNIYDLQNFKKSSQSRPIAPAAASHASINPSSHFLPHNFGAMYSQMPSIMMQPGMPFLRQDFPFARHIMPVQLAATTGVPSRSSIGQPGRGHPPTVAHHLKPGGIQNQIHAIPGLSVPVHPSSTLQQTRSPSPQPSQDTSTSDGPKGDIKSQAAPTEAHSVSETRPANSSEPASRSGIHQTTSISTVSKTMPAANLVKNPLGITGQGIGVSPYVKQIHTTTATPRMSTGERTSISGTSIGPPSSVTSNFAIGTLYSQPPAVSFAPKNQQLQDHNRLLKPNSSVSSGSFVGHTGTLTTVVSTPTVPSVPNARVDGHRTFPLSYSRMPPYFDSHPVSSLQPAMKSYAPIESVVRKPTTISQVPTNIAAASSGHVTAGINSVQLMTSHSPAASVAVVNMGVSFPNSDAGIGNENTTVHSNVSQSNSTGIFSVQSMLSTTQSSSSSNISSANNVTSLSPRPSILRKRQELSRKLPNQPSSVDPMVVISANDISASPRSDGTLSASHSRQNSPKSEPVSQNLDQCHKTLENGTNHASLSSPLKVKRELLPSPSSPPTSSSTVNQVGITTVAAHDVVASPRKKPRKQNVVATEDKYSSSPMQVDGNMTNAVNEKVDQEDDEELKFLMLKRRCVSIFGGYKVNPKAAHNHFQKYSDVKARDERKPSLQEIASERSITQRATGWKIHHVAAQLDELKSCEEEVLMKMYEFRERLPKYKPDHKRHDDMAMLHELLQGNIQRSQLVIEQLGETKKTTVKILDHKSGIMDILQKNSKRTVKKKS